MSYGSIYDISWFGDVNAPNGWGSIYPFDADGSIFTSDTTLVLADTTEYTSDKTIF